MDFPQALRVYREDILDELRQAVSDSDLPLYDMMRYHLGWQDDRGWPLGDGGKLLRSSLCLCACQAVGGDWRQALPAAASVELVHNFSLVHDDIEDESVARRSRPTVWQVWGPAQAINAGDAMHALARLALLRMADRGVPAEKVLQAIHIIDQTCLKLCEGQYKDLDFEGRLELGLDDYLDMISGKTAALFEAAFHLGALVGADDDGKVEALRACGHKLGVAYQMRDDILGVWGQAELTGKPQGGDIRQRKKSLPIVYALDRAQGSQRTRLLQALGQPDVSDEAVAAVMDILEALKVRQSCQRLARQYAEDALSNLDSIELSHPCRQMLEEVARFLVERHF